MKKIVIYLIVGIMQIGLFSTVTEASALYNNNSQRIVQFDHRDHHDRDHHRNRHRDRHHHDDNKGDIIAGIIFGIIIGNH